ncbi:uncharacterized protein BJ171DRAFT_474482 [Polychytrium aggregatum]|uniref:uncharacterized protein n=1 Tax=Polychytrium aggregatum TaxID=110093 RepID=UPI0022FEE271|nr:uncharacterized protein BJ171DRAFT_474482 [Polychytrium aggregatum]KAI9205061.1 hypothetical protein BJ171DRAFT_474482 [Polychytrium aggregatum]
MATAQQGTVARTAKFVAATRTLLRHPGAWAVWPAAGVRSAVPPRVRDWPETAQGDWTVGCGKLQLAAWSEQLERHSVCARIPLSVCQAQGPSTADHTSQVLRGQRGKGGGPKEPCSVQTELEQQMAACQGWRGRTASARQAGGEGSLGPGLAWPGLALVLATASDVQGRAGRGRAGQGGLPTDTPRPCWTMCGQMGPSKSPGGDAGGCLLSRSGPESMLPKKHRRTGNGKDAAPIPADRNRQDPGAGTVLCAIVLVRAARAVLRCSALPCLGHKRNNGREQILMCLGGRGAHPCTSPWCTASASRYAVGAHKALVAHAA